MLVSNQHGGFEGNLIRSDYPGSCRWNDVTSVEASTCEYLRDLSEVISPRE